MLYCRQKVIRVISMNERITDIHCPNCGSPARFDIIHQDYGCPNCGSRVGIDEAQKQTQGFRRMRIGHLRQTRESFQLFSAACNGCGAEVVFDENEAVSTCAFCGLALVRSEYLKADELPENVIPFALTLSEARQRLREWCQTNRSKREARELLALLDDLKGFYLPYQLIRGPVHMKVSRMDGFRNYDCEGFIRDEFVNCSSQLDNLLLDGMEPFDINELKGFDFAYVAGQQVKIPDISEQSMEARTAAEAGEIYSPAIRRTLESKAVEVAADVSDAMRLPVLLPVYYICHDQLMAAVNGQSGRVSVRSLKRKKYYFLPWWLKAIIATIVFCLISFLAFRAFGMSNGESLYITGLLGLFFIIVILCLYSDTVHNRFIVETEYDVYTSGRKTFRREYGKLVAAEEMIERKIEQPVYFESLDGQKKPVVLRFTTPLRVIRMVFLCFVVLFLPVICALLINGFDFQKLSLGGSAAWFCIFVPVVPIYLLKFGIVGLHDNPWIYVINEKGRKKRYHRKIAFNINWDVVKTVLRALFVPPVSLAVWFGIIGFIVMVYLTAGGE